MLLSAKEIDGSGEEFLTLWEEFKSAVNKNELNFDVKQLERFDEQIKSAQYPVMHHSPAYREANLPAYRVVNKRIAEELLSEVVF